MKQVLILYASSKGNHFLFHPSVYQQYTSPRLQVALIGLGGFCPLIIGERVRSSLIEKEEQLRKCAYLSTCFSNVKTTTHHHNSSQISHSLLGKYILR